jgi:peroxiredoxin
MTQAVDFTLPSTQGQVSLQGLKGRPFLLSFFSMAFTPV